MIKLYLVCLGITIKSFSILHIFMYICVVIRKHVFYNEGKNYEATIELKHCRVYRLDDDNINAK